MEDYTLGQAIVDIDQVLDGIENIDDIFEIDHDGNVEAIINYLSSAKTILEDMLEGLE